MSQSNSTALMEVSLFAEYLNRLEISRNIYRLQVHHTWKPSYKDFDGSNHLRLQSSMRRYHMEEKGWDDIAQHFTVFPDGMVATGRDLNSHPIGISGANTGAICIEILGNFDEGKDEMSEAQKDAVLEVYAILCRCFSIEPRTDTIVYHTWFADWKSCPGTTFFGGNTRADAEREFYPMIREQIRGQVDEVAAIPATAPSLMDKFGDVSEEIFTKAAFWKKKKGAQSDAPSFWEKVGMVLGITGATALLFWWFSKS